jgi:hypothetical protein
VVGGSVVIPIRDEETAALDPGVTPARVADASPAGAAAAPTAAAQAGEAIQGGTSMPASGDAVVAAI